MESRILPFRWTVEVFRPWAEGEEWYCSNAFNHIGQARAMQAQCEYHYGYPARVRRYRKQDFRS